MAAFLIYDGRTSFWQWDVGQRLIVSDDVCCEVHFCNGTTECALVCEVYKEDGKRLVNVPNILLQTGKPLRVFAFAQGDGDERTTFSEMFTVIPRTKPDDYVYTETELWTAEKAVEKAVAEAVASGDFKGDKGDKGDAGVIEFIVVNELPESDIKNAIYLMADDNAEEGNLFGEYVYIDGAWERVGSAGVEIDLDDYVKKTDYASNSVPGLVRCESYNGVTVNSANGGLVIYKATNADVDAKAQQHRPITPANLDYAVKVGLTTNAITLTDEEKVAAQDWLGVTEQIGDIEAALDEIHAYAQVLVGGGAE